MTELARGAASLINTTWPPYNRWPAEFPPIGAALVTAAERTFGLSATPIDAVIAETVTAVAAV
ncbi:hypothetical protein [Nocardia sp. NBC_01388]|uniref:hypothetical protein n=1 Tax=Nocardia sp. NBC_01388 TaxID=2903596 RepID=UPI00324A7B45